MKWQINYLLSILHTYVDIIIFYCNRRIRSLKEMKPTIVCILLSFFLVVMLFSTVPVSGECCYAEWKDFTRRALLDGVDDASDSVGMVDRRRKRSGYYCEDGSEGTPCCGQGSCNMFCCDCDDGCK